MKPITHELKPRPIREVAETIRDIILEDEKLKTVEEILKQEFSADFVQKMKNRVAVSYFKYGAAGPNFQKLSALKSAMLRVQEYERTKNTEFLVDAANYLMFEFRFPSLEGAHFRATDSDESPGNVTREGKVTKGTS